MDLITLDDYKKAKGILSPKEDERLQYLITSVSQLVKTYCGTSFVDYINVDKVQNFSVKYSGTYKIQTSEFPLIEVSEILVRDSESSDYYEVTEFELDAESDYIYRLQKPWPVGVNSVIVSYRAGYEVLPEELKLVMVDLVHYYLKEEYKSAKSLHGASIRNQTTSSLRGNLGFPDHIKRVLDLYRNI